MRGYAVFECVDKEAELRIRFFVRKSEHFKHLGLQLGVVNSYRAAARFHAVDYYIISLCANLARVGVDKVEVLEHRRRERVVLGNVSALFLAVFKQRELRYPKKFVHILGVCGVVRYLVKTFRNFAAQCAESVIRHLIFIRNDERAVAVFQTERRNKRVLFLVRKEFEER